MVDHLVAWMVCLLISLQMALGQHWLDVVLLILPLEVVVVDWYHHVKEEPCQLAVS